MAKLLQLRRGTTTQHNTFTGAAGEVTVDTDKETLVVHPGGTEGGGEPLLREDLNNMPNSGVTAGTYGSSTAIPAITVDAKGLVTGATTTAIDSTSISNGTTNVTANAGNIELDVSGSNVITADSAGLLLRDQSNVRFADADSSTWVALQAPTSVGSNVTFTLPGADGQAGQALTTDGSANLGFTNLPSITSSSAAPANPNDNDLWYDTDDGRLYFRYNDGTSTQWVDASPEGGPGSNEFNSVRLNGSTSGWIQLEAPANAPSSTIVFPATSGTNGAYLQTNGAGVTSWQTITPNTSTLTRSTAQATTSGTSVEFTGIASTARKITIMFNGTSTSGNDIVLVRLGSGSLATSGYSGTWNYTNGSSTATGDVTNGIPLGNGDAGYAYYGTITLTNVSGNTWLGSGVLLGDYASTNAILNGAGWITLGGTLDRVGVAVGAGAFDAGSVNILVETE